MTQAIRFDRTGGPEVLQLRSVDLPAPAPGEVTVRHAAIGLNFIDVYQRTGLYPNTLPLALGMEGAGVIEAVGEGVTHLKVGDRAAYASQPPGAYCDVRVMPAMNVCRRVCSITPCRASTRTMERFAVLAPVFAEAARLEARFWQQGLDLEHLQQQ